LFGKDYGDRPPQTSIWLVFIRQKIVRIQSIFPILASIFFSSQAVRLELHSLYKVFSYNRIGVLFFFIVFVALGWTEWPLILFGVIDAAAGLWTLSALKREGC
jgi:hypothetical protein